MIDLDLPAELVWDVKCETGESCTYDAAHDRVLFCDIPAGVIHACSVAGGGRRSWKLPELVASFGMCRSGRLVVALRGRVVLFDPATDEVIPLAGPLDQPATVRLNDGKVGPDGCFWVGGRDESPAKTAEAALWRITPDGRAERKAEGYMTCNGLAWSPDATVMFHTDSRRGALDAWDFDVATGAIANRRRIATLGDADGRTAARPTPRAATGRPARPPAASTASRRPASGSRGWRCRCPRRACRASPGRGFT